MFVGWDGTSLGARSCSFSPLDCFPLSVCWSSFFAHSSHVVVWRSTPLPMRQRLIFIATCNCHVMPEAWTRVSPTPLRSIRVCATLRRFRVMLNYTSLPFFLLNSSDAIFCGELAKWNVSSVCCQLATHCHFEMCCVCNVLFVLGSTSFSSPIIFSSSSCLLFQFFVSFKFPLWVLN